MSEVIVVRPTTEQLRVIEESDHCVVIASPGSGKTLTVSLKIKGILPELPHFRGVIAISFTNKASDELERRCLTEGLDQKSSFFGTIDSFFLSEIIIPFGTHVFGLPLGGFQETVLLEQIEEAGGAKIPLAVGNYSEIERQYLPIFKKLYLEGKVILESFGFLALYILKSSA